MKENIVLLTLNNYVRPQVVENTSKNWVLNGRNNSFYQYVIDRYNGSPTNAAIINSYVDLIYGKGLRATNAKQNIDDWVKFKTILSRKDLRRIISDFELFGEASMEVIQTKGKDLSSISHVAKNLVVPSVENEDCEIESYWFSKDWAKYSQAKNKPVEIDAFQGTHKKEMYVISPYKAGKNYFSDPDYLAGLPYAEMEEEIANLNINSIQKGLSAGYIINIPDGNSYTDEEKEEFKKQVKRKLTSSENASDFIISFNGVEESITITPFPVNENIHKQWQFLTEESRQQLLTAHRVTSPMLFGIKDNTGFGNNAEELKDSAAMLSETVIASKQMFILDALEDILITYGINLDLEFIPLISPKVVEPQATQLSIQCSHDNELDAVLELYAEDAPEGYDLTDGAEYDLQLAATSKSKQDTDKWIVRYAYDKGTSKTPDGKSRNFCNRMMSLSKSGKVFREEDIIKMGKDGVNGQFAHTGGSYSIWLYAGGVNCYHVWQRRIFKKKEQENGELYKGNPMQNVTPVNVSEAKRQGWKHKGTPNAKDVAKAEIDKPNHGSLK